MNTDPRQPDEPDASTVEGLLSLLDLQRSLLIAVATGGPAINSVDSSYKDRRTKLRGGLARLGLEYPYPWRSLWDWYNYYSEKLGTYAQRRSHINQLTDNILVDLESRQLQQDASIGHSVEKDVHSVDEVLSEGVPPWLKKSISDWIDTQFEHWDDHSGEPYCDYELLLAVERGLRIPLNWHSNTWSTYNSFREQISADDKVLLRLLDFLLARLEDDLDGHQKAATLSQYLTEGGSTWTVFTAYPFRLERRVAEPTTVVARDIMAQKSRPTELLRAAWKHCFGQSPEPGLAYREAVRAVEAAAKPVILPKNEKATMGTMISALRDAPQKWKVALPVPDSFPSVETVTAMLELLWKGQIDRHGTDNTTIPLSVTPDEAEAAVHLAMLLVQWFTRRVVLLHKNQPDWWWVGQEITHSRWGPGIITSLSGFGEKTQGTIWFEKEGEKRILLFYAPIDPSGEDNP